MPTISSSRVQPLVTPSTALFTSARARPWTAACESFSRTATRWPSFCSILMPAGRDVSSLPFGPCTRTVLPSNLTVTPLGSGIGFFPIRDIDRPWLFALGSCLFAVGFGYKPRANGQERFFLPNLAQHFAAHALFAGLAAGHHPTRRGENVDSHASQHPRNFAAAHVDATAGTRYALGLRDSGFVVCAVFQVDPDDLVAFLFRGFEIGDVALFLQDAGNLQLQP